VTATLLTSDPDTIVQSSVVVGSSPIRREVVHVLRHEGFEISVADSLDALGEACLEQSPSLIVLIGDEPIPARSSVLASVRKHSMDAHIVLVRSAIEGWEVRGALDAGAAGIVLAAEAPTALGPCLLAVRAGQVCVPRRNRGQIEPPVLSAREKQILGLVVMGYMNSQIAERLFLAESTVKSHLSSVFSKLAVHSRHEAVDLILDPDRGQTLGILGLGAEPLQHSSSATP